MRQQFPPRRTGGSGIRTSPGEGTDLFFACISQVDVKIRLPDLYRARVAVRGSAPRLAETRASEDQSWRLVIYCPRTQLRGGIYVSFRPPDFFRPVHAAIRRAQFQRAVRVVRRAGPNRAG